MGREQWKRDFADNITKLELCSKKSVLRQDIEKDLILIKRIIIIFV